MVANDVVTLDELFRNDPCTIRYGAAENLYGHAEIAAFRASRSPAGLARILSRTVISTYGLASGTGHRDKAVSGHSVIKKIKTHTMGLRRSVRRVIGVIS